ncbi:MAG: tyrosine-protein phosphatase [Lentisphaerae bacterium]|nr:tyrosine-protein phosphatase [Lentisphaerota bacterium]
MQSLKPVNCLLRMASCAALLLSASTALAGRYWLGGDGYWLDTAKWASDSTSTTGGANVPDSSGGTVYFNNSGSLVFNAGGNIGSSDVKINSGTSSEPVVWSASEPSYGLTTTGKIRVGADSTPGALTIESGTYSAAAVYVPRKEASGAYGRFVFNGGKLTVSDNCYVGYKAGTEGEFVLNGGDIIVNKDVFYLGEGGTGSFTMNDGTFTMVDSGYGFCICHDTDGTVAEVTLNGGVLTTPKFRIDKLGSTETGTIVFNGGTLKATRNQDDYIATNPNLSCVLQSGGLVVDTAGYNVGIAHEFTGSGPLIKKGAGTLTVADASKFTEVIVYEGTAIVGGTTYTQNAGPIGIDVSAGGSYGPYALHGNKLESWLEAPLNFTHFSSSTANGTASYEMPESLTFTVGSEVKNWTNLKTGETYEDTLGGVEYSFTTKAVAPRTIKIEAPDGTTVANVRDVGSWPLESLDGKRMNQNVLFRGGNLDGFQNATAEERSASFLSRIGLKTEIELRPVGVDQPSFYSGATASFAADDCEYVDCGMSYNGGPQLDSGNSGNFTNMIRKVFSTWGTQGKLPSYFHCRIGRDRTGIVGLLVLGLMGVEEETLYRDYLMSNFAKLESGLVSPTTLETSLGHLHRGWCRNGGEYVYSDNDYGRSIAARCRAYLEMCGVTSEEIANITQALSGETPSEVLERVDAYETANNFRTVSYVPYEGSSTTNAMHRLAAGQHILPTATPSREGWLFGGWDTDNEIDTGDGTAVVYALWSVDNSPKTRYWADGNGESEKFNRVESWDPAPSSMSDVEIDTLVLNKGVDKVATFEVGDSVSAANLYVGRGANNPGGRLDVSGGNLSVTNDFIVGADASSVSNVVNITGGRVSVKRLRTGTGRADGTRRDVVNISGEGTVFEATGEETRLSADAGGISEMNIINGATYSSPKTFVVGYAGSATLVLDGGTFELSGDHDLNVCNGGGANAVVDLRSGSATIHTLNITQNGGTGVVNIGADCSLVTSWAFYMGANAELNVNGVFDTSVSVNVGNRTGGPSVVNLNGDGTKRGLIKTTEFVAVNNNATLNWNGGRLMREPSGFIHVNDVLPAVSAQGAQSPLKVVVGANGAYYESENSSSDDSISLSLSGVGAFNKLGEGTLTIKGAFSCRGGINVEGGALAFQSGAIALADMKEISVYEDGKLDLGGAQVTVRTYRVAGDSQLPGTYHEQGGTIRVLSAEALVPVAGEWRNLAGDGDFANADNWIVRNASGDVLFDMLPTTDTDVVVVYDGFARDCSSIQCRSIKVVVESDARFAAPDEIAAAAPEFARSALAWYDLADASTVTVNGDSRLTNISNKGVAGSVMNATCAVGPSKYGEKVQRWRNLLAMKEEFGFSSPKGSVNTAMAGSEAMTLVVLSRNVPKVKSETETVTRMYTMGIVNDGGSPNRTFSFSIEDDKGSGSSSVKYGANVEMGGVTKSPLNEWNIWTLRYDPATHEVSATRCGMDGEVTAFGPESVGEMSLPAECALFIGVMPRNGYQSSCGDIAEAFMFGSALSDNQLEAMRTYLGNKWLGSIERQIVPGCLEIAQAATLDFGGGDWTLDTVKGAGTIGTANVTVTGSLEAGLTVGGTVTFAQGATIDLSPFDTAEIGTHVVVLTADKIENWPTKIRSKSRVCALRLVENANGTVSLEGDLSAAGFAIKIR